MKKIGIDDAGRGPVIGPMVLCGVMVDTTEAEPLLQKLGAKDSKLLTAKQRRLLAQAIRNDYVYHTEVVTPQEIDSFPNLNNLEAVTCGIIINTLMKDIDERVLVVVDCPSVNIAAWSDLLMSMLVKKEQVDLVCEHKADASHPVVSAASIVAKETREEHLAVLKKELGINFGSGYPSDPLTKDFLVKTFGDPTYDLIIRKSWSTYKRIAERFDQKKLFYL